jgi:hypothetical protein
MATKTRDGNLVIGDFALLKQYLYNGNSLSDIVSVDQVDIYFLDPDLRTCDNPSGKVLVESFPGSATTNPDSGVYELSVYLNPSLYEIGQYNDQWTATFDIASTPSTINGLFKIYPDLWYASGTPITYLFNWYWLPNMIPFGAIQNLNIEITPITPTASDLESYYVALQTVGKTYITISKFCGPCTDPCKGDDILIEDYPLDIVNVNKAYYLLDTNEFGAGVFNIQFKLLLGGSTYLSPKSQLLIYT